MSEYLGFFSLTDKCCRLRSCSVAAPYFVKRAVVRTIFGFWNNKIRGPLLYIQILNQKVSLPFWKWTGAEKHKKTDFIFLEKKNNDRKSFVIDPKFSKFFYPNLNQLHIDNLDFMVQFPYLVQKNVYRSYLVTQRSKHSNDRLILKKI